MRARIAACTTASASAGRTRARSAGTTPPPSAALQPGKPPAENQRSFTANSQIRRIANQKLGRAMPIWLTLITPTSPTRPWRAAANRPSEKASAVVSSIAIDASGTVTTRRSPTSCAIGVS